MAQSDISRNPTKGFLRDGEMPPFPEQTVHAMLKRFGMEEACDLQPWPYGPYDILAAFSFRGTGYLLKARIFEHRGERSLYETHYIQERLLALGLSLASYYSAPGGEFTVNSLIGVDDEYRCDSDGEIFAQFLLDLAAAVRRRENFHD